MTINVATSFWDILEQYQNYLLFEMVKWKQKFVPYILSVFDILDRLRMFIIFVLRILEYENLTMFLYGQLLDYKNIWGSPTDIHGHRKNVTAKFSYSTIRITKFVFCVTQEYEI